MCFPLSCFFLLIPPPPTSTLFLYTTLFRSLRGSRPAADRPERLLPGRSREVRRCRERFGSGRHRRQRQHRRSEEHTSELQSRGHLVCRLLLEKKKIHKKKNRLMRDQTLGER